MTVYSNNSSIKKRSPAKSTSPFAIRWVHVIVTTLIVSANLIHQTHGFRPFNGESRKLFGGYRITPKQCRSTKTLPSTDPRAKGPTICMFNHECAQRNGEVVGACMDGFLFGACCQVPNNQLPGNTLINDAQNSYFHQYQNQKLQQQETETNKIVSQAYETFAENSAHQQTLSNSQAQNAGYGGAISNLYQQDHVDSHNEEAAGQIKPINSNVASTESVISSTSLATNSITQASTQSQSNTPHEPPKINLSKDSVKISSPSQLSQNNDFVLQVLNTLPPGEGNKTINFTTEIPTKIASTLNEQISSESNSFEEEPMAATKKPPIKKPATVQQHHTQSAQQQQTQSGQHHYYNTESAVQQQQQHEHHTEAIPNDADELFGGVSFTHSDITHPGADSDLIEDDLQFSTGYGPQPVFLPAPSKPNESNKHTLNAFDATTPSSSSITTHVDSIETIIQQLNNNESNPGPSYSVINHHGQQQQQQQHQSPAYGNDPEFATKRPMPYAEEDHTKHNVVLASLSYNEIDDHSDKQNAANLYDQTSSSIASSSSSSSSASSAGESTTPNTVYDDEIVLEDHTMPQDNYNDFQPSKHPTSDFNKMPAIGIAYPVDMSYMEDGGNSEAYQQVAHQQNSQNSYTNQQQQDTNISFLDNKHQQQQNIQNTQANTQQHQTQQQIENAQSSHLNTYSTQSDEEDFSQPQTIQNYVAETHQRPIASYTGMVTSQSYDPQPLPHEVIVSSHTTKVEENTEVSTEYKPIITTNQIITSHKTTARPVKHTVSSTLYTKRPTLVTKKPNSRKPTKASSQRPATNTYVTTNSISIQQHYPTTPLETKTPSTAGSLHSKPTPAYNQGIQQDYIIDSGSTPKPIVNRKTTKKPHAKPASNSYITGPTTPRPIVTPQFQYDQEVPVIQADDKLDSFVLSTAESLASATPTQESLPYDPPVFISAVSQAQNQRPQYNSHKKPGFVKVQQMQRPPSSTVLITPRPSSLQTTANTFTTPQYTTALLGYESTSFVYNSLVTRKPDFGKPDFAKPDFVENTAGDYMGISTVNSNDFDDPGYYGSADHSKPHRPLFVSGSTEGIYPVPSDDKPAFPGYYGPTPTYPAFQVPADKLDSPLEEEVYTSPNDFINFPPVRNPNLNMSATSSSVSSDLALSTPAFVEDSILKNKMNTLVHKIVESLQGNFEALADMLDDNNNTAAIQSYQASALDSTAATRKPTRRPVTKVTTVKTKVTTKKPITRVSTKAPTKRPGSTRKPEITTKRPVTRRTTTTTKRPATRKPTRKATTTTRAPNEDDLVDEEDEEDVNPSDNEIVDDESYGASGSGRKIQCGMRPHAKSGRIVGGKGAAFGAYPWQILVRESTWLGLFTKNKCGGVLITSRYVITAAHCQPGFLASLVAVMGEFDISGDLESKRAVTKNVKRVIVHRQYDAATFENDIALLELDSPVTFDTHIVPICMPSDAADFTGRMATVTGWGRLKYGGGVPSVLQEVQVPVIENSVCQEMFITAGHNKKILNSFLCAGYANGQKDSCEGDSGGPLVLQRPDGRYELAGTVSHGIKCAAPYLPGVYMRTTFYKPWLRSITGVK